VAGVLAGEKRSDDWRGGFVSHGSGYRGEAAGEIKN